MRTEGATPMRVLVAEDNAISRLTLRSQLRKWGYEVVEATDGEAAWAILSQPDSPRLAILDWMMPGIDGVEVCRRVRTQGQEPYVYLLLLTGREGKDDVIAGLDAGADDYVTKPFDAQELRVRLRAGERICTLQSQLVAARESLRYQATHDHLTGVWNRAAILEALDRERQRAVTEGVGLAVAMLDLDHFKRVNDQYGHLMGDAVLRHSIARVKANLRPTDLVGRYGGEEFLVVMPDCDAAGASAVCERLCKAVASEPVVLDAVVVPITVSIGTATSTDPGDSARMVERADLALYRAKSAGRNRVEIAPTV